MAKAPFEIWVGNLAAYNAGILTGEWIPLPQKEEVLDEAIAKISRDGKDEIMIMDYSIESNCRFMRNYIKEWDDVTELNTIARLIGNEEHRKVEAYLEDTSELSLLEVANLFMQEDEISFYPYEFEGSDNLTVMDTLSDEEKMGYTILESDMELKNQLESMQIAGVSVLNYPLIKKLSDIEKALNYLDGGRLSDEISISAVMESAKLEGTTKNVRCKFFDITFFKKGTCHIVFRDDELLKKLNIFGSQQKGWLPQDYGRKAYNEMTQAEKTVIDSFEGEIEYNKTLDKADFYIYNPENNMLKLA